MDGEKGKEAMVYKMKGGERKKELEGFENDSIGACPKRLLVLIWMYNSFFLTL